MKLLAETAATEVELDLAALFTYQFTLLPDASSTIDGFRSLPFRDRTLHHCPKLEVATLRDKAGRDVGYCLGVAVDDQGHRVQDRQIDSVESGSPDFWSAIETFAVGLGGRWLLLITDGEDARIFGDASGQYNCVYDPKTGVVGATLLMSLTREIEESDEFDYRDTLINGLRLPFGRTRDRHARRLAVNHYLKLSDLTETRFWPKAGDLTEVEQEDTQGIVIEIRDRLAQIFAAIVTTSPTSVAMSGGNDSRNVVAAGKGALSHVKSFFSHVHNRNSRADYQSAARVMDTLGYTNVLHPAAPEGYTEAEISKRNAIFQRSTGYSVGLHQMSNVKLNTLPSAGHVVITGNVMEALRAAHWNSAVRSRRHNLKFGLKRCLFFTSNFTSEFIQRWLPEFRNWHSLLPPDAQRAYIDLVFVEHNLPNLGTVFHATSDSFTVCPFNDRRLIALCARLPLDYRFTNQANSDLLALSAPELVDIPFAGDLMRASADRRAV